MEFIEWNICLLSLMHVISRCSPGGLVDGQLATISSIAANQWMYWAVSVNTASVSVSCTVSLSSSIDLMDVYLQYVFVVSTELNSLELADTTHCRTPPITQALQLQSIQHSNMWSHHRTHNKALGIVEFIHKREAVHHSLLARLLLVYPNASPTV